MELVDVSDLSEDELQVLIGVHGPDTVAQATGLPVERCRELSPVSSSPSRHPAAAKFECPRCGRLRWQRTTSPHQRCGHCVRARRQEKLAAARQVLEAGLRGYAAEQALIDAGITGSVWYARNMLRDVRREHPELRKAAA